MTGAFLFCAPVRLLDLGAVNCDSVPVRIVEVIPSKSSIASSSLGPNSPSLISMYSSSPISSSFWLTSWLCSSSESRNNGCDAPRDLVDRVERFAEDWDFVLEMGFLPVAFRCVGFASLSSESLITIVRVFALLDDCVRGCVFGPGAFSLSVPKKLRLCDSG